MSKLSKLGHFFQRVGKIAPAILAFTPLAPIAPLVAAAVQEAEAIKGATGPEKLAHVKAIVTAAVRVANQEAGHQVIGATDLDAAIDHGVGAIISAVNAVRDPG